MYVETAQSRRLNVLNSSEERMNKVTGMWKKDKKDNLDCEKEMSARDRRLMKQRLARERRRKKDNTLKAEVVEDLFKDSVELSKKLGNIDDIPKDLVLPSPNSYDLFDNTSRSRLGASELCSFTIVTCGLLSGHVGSVPFESMGLTMIFFALLRKILPIFMREKGSSGLMAMMRGTGTWVKDITFFVFSFGLVRTVIDVVDDVSYIATGLALLVLSFTILLVQRRRKCVVETELSHVVKAMLQHVKLLNSCGGGHDPWIETEKIQQHIVSHYFVSISKKYPKAEDRDSLWQKTLHKLRNMNGISIRDDGKMCWNGEIENDMGRLKTNTTSKEGLSQREIRLQKQRKARSFVKS